MFPSFPSASPERIIAISEINPPIKSSIEKVSIPHASETIPVTTAEKGIITETAVGLTNIIAIVLKNQHKTLATTAVPTSNKIFHKLKLNLIVSIGAQLTFITYKSIADTNDMTTPTHICNIK